jgi:glycosyltransferase involved in cell wall biosynthesis
LTPKKFMRIGIDARFYGSIGKGLGRYTQKLIENLEKIDSSNEYFIFLKKENFDDYRPHSKNFQKVLADYRWYSLKEQLKMPALLNKYNLDLVHFPHFNVPLFYRKKFVVTIHDLILIHFPTIRGTTLNPLYYWLKFLAYKFIIQSAIRRSEHIIAVSNFTKKDILDNYGVPENKISVTYEACEDFCNLPLEKSKNILEKYGIIKPYLLYVGNAYPHKNLEKLILEFSQFQKENGQYHLVLVGKEDYFYRQLKKLVGERKSKNTIFPGHIPDCDLDFVYREASLYVFPSLYEGFGLPPLEAMAKGVPVLSSSHPCMREILGDSAYFIDAQKNGELISGIKKILSDDFLRSGLIQKGYRQCRKYSWLEMAEKTLAIYKKNENQKK